MRVERQGMTCRPGGWLAAGLVAAAMLAAGGLTLFRHALDAAAEEAAAAQESHPGDPVEALIHRANSEALPLRTRTRAVWALGELRDRRALRHLDRLQVQQACDHERFVCQREVRLAMAKIRGELSLGHSLRRAWKKLGRQLDQHLVGPDGGSPRNRSDQDPEGTRAGES